MARRIVIVAFDGVLGIEVFGVRDLLGLANWQARQDGRPEPFTIEFASPKGEPVDLWAGPQLIPDRSLAASRVAIDTLVVCGGPTPEVWSTDAGLVAAVRRAAPRARRVAGVCTGVFLLAEAGLLDGRRVTTHWGWGEMLAERYPALHVDIGPMVIADDHIWTSGGVTSGFDLVLAMLEDDLGVAHARSLARLAALYLRRTGSQAQFSASTTRHPLGELQQYVIDQPAADHSLAALAARMHMSTRHFARLFRAEFGTSPHRFVEGVRLQEARRRLEETNETVEAIASAAGFGNYQAMRRSFIDQLELTPAEYRRRFEATALVGGRRS